MGSGASQMDENVLAKRIDMYGAGNAKPGSFFVLLIPIVIFVVIFTVFFEHGDLGSGENVTVELCIELSDGRSFPLKDRCRVPSSDGAETTLLLTGSVKEGFRIEQ